MENYVHSNGGGAVSQTLLISRQFTFRRKISGTESLPSQRLFGLRKKWDGPKTRLDFGFNGYRQHSEGLTVGNPLI